MSVKGNGNISKSWLRRRGKRSYNEGLVWFLGCSSMACTHLPLLHAHSYHLLVFRVGPKEKGECDECWFHEGRQDAVRVSAHHPILFAAADPPPISSISHD